MFKLPYFLAKLSREEGGRELYTKFGLILKMSSLKKTVHFVRFIDTVLENFPISLNTYNFFQIRLLQKNFKVYFSPQILIDFFWCNQLKKKLFFVYNHCLYMFE